MAKKNAVESSKAQRYFFNLPQSEVTAIIIIIAIAALLFYFRGLFVAATVNGKPISRFDVIRQLESSTGKQALDSLVTKELILQEAKKRGITVSPKEIADELVKIEANVKKQGGSLDEALAAQGMTKEILKEQVLLQKLLEKMFIKELRVTEKEIDQFMEQNKANLPAVIEATEQAALRQSIKQQIQQNKLGQKVQELIKNLKNLAKINFFVKY